MKRKTLVSLIALAVTLMLVLSGCGKTTEPSTKPVESTEKNAGPTVNYPTKTITMVVGNAAGGGSDVCARLLAQYLQDELGCTVVVTNNPTGSGEAAFIQVSQSNKDGYTIGFMHAGQALATLTRDTKYDLNKDVDFVAMQTSEPRVLVIRADETRFTDYPSFAKYAKENPEQLIITDSGVNGNEHLANEAIQYYGDYKLTVLHTNGTAEGKAQLLGGHVDAVMMSLAEAYPMYTEKTGKLIALTADDRHTAIPDVPTLKEMGVDFSVDVYRGLYIAKDTPEEIIKILSDAVGKVSQNKEYIEALAKLTLAPKYQDYQTFRKSVFEDLEGKKDFLKTIGWIK